MDVKEINLQYAHCKTDLVSSNQESEKEIGKYQIKNIQDWGPSLIVYLENITDVRYPDAIKIYVDKDAFQSQFPVGSYVTRMQLTPAETKVVSIDGGVIEYSNIEEYFINDSNQEKSQKFYPWDPYW